MLAEHQSGRIEIEAKLVRTAALRMEIGTRLIVSRGDYVPVGNQEVFAGVTPYESRRVSEHSVIEKLDHRNGSQRVFVNGGRHSVLNIRTFGATDDY